MGMSIGGVIYINFGVDYYPQFTQCSAVTLKSAHLFTLNTALYGRVVAGHLPSYLP